MFKWKEEFSVNVQKIDEQHQELFKLGTELYTLISARDGMDRYDEIMKVIIELGEYTVYHFDFEENLMKENGYPDLEKHKIQHDAFVAKIKSISVDDVDMKQKRVTMDLIAFIANWIENHILNTDMQYKEFLNQKGTY